MAHKRKSTPAQNPLHSGASSSSDSTPLNLRFRDEDAHKAFSDNFSRRGIHSERQEFYSNMHGINRSVPLFFTRVRGTRIPITPQLVADVLWVPRIEFPDYPSCERLRTVSKDELISAFYEHPAVWGEHQYTSCRPFAKDSAFRDKLILPSAITRILRNFSISFPVSDHFTHICAIDATTVKRSEAQFRSRQPNSTPPSRSAPFRSAPSTSAPSSSTGDVSLGDIMAQLQCVDTRLDTLSIELYQVNVRVGRIARR
nr:hypothetical protein CFP56_39345 [Quercus suber]